MLVFYFIACLCNGFISSGSLSSLYCSSSYYSLLSFFFCTFFLLLQSKHVCNILLVIKLLCGLKHLQLEQLHLSFSSLSMRASFINAIHSRQYLFNLVPCNGMLHLAQVLLFYIVIHMYIYIYTLIFESVD